MIVEPAYFDQMYAASADPWGFTSRSHEKRKYAITLAMLPREQYAEAFEPGCSIGVMTEQLAPRCSRLLSCDVAEAAVHAAARRTAGQPGLSVIAEHREADFVAEVYRRGQPVSVAQATGLA